MKSFGVSIIAATALVCAAMPSHAQNTTTPPPGTLEKPVAVPQTDGSGTEPEGKGSTGWTGGARQPSETTGQSDRNPDPEAAENQPYMATGKDLKGPPMRFPANKTPE